MKKFVLITIIGLLCLPALADNRAVINRHLEEKDDKKAMHHILIELEDKKEAEINTFINEFIDVCNKQEREYLKQQVAMRLYVASTPKEPTGALLDVMRSYGILLGDQVPNFAVNDSTKLYDVLGKQTLLFFYETSCNLCHEQKNELIVNRQQLEEKGITIVSIDCNVEQTTQQAWQYNIADPMGKIYHPYGVLSTPTFMLLDSNGILMLRTNKLTELKATN